LIAEEFGVEFEAEFKLLAVISFCHGFAKRMHLIIGVEVSAAVS
jgi:hypothetical protein